MAYSTDPAWEEQQKKFEKEFNELVLSLPNDRQNLWSGNFDWKLPDGAGIPRTRFPAGMDTAMFDDRIDEYRNLYKRYMEGKL